MVKLGYTWYPKDWGNSESVFELTLIERGLYRELIDMAMLNDNKTIYNAKIWARKFGSTEEEIEGILITLKDLKLIELNGDVLFIPSCESRLNLVRGGSKGGKKSKPASKPFESLEENNEKPTSNQIEKEIESININTNKHEFFKNECLQSQQFLEAVAMKEKIPLDKMQFALKDFNIHLVTTGEIKKDLKEYKYHFTSWVRKMKELKQKDEQQKNKDRL